MLFFAKDPVRMYKCAEFARSTCLDRLNVEYIELCCARKVHVLESDCFQAIAFRIRSHRVFEKKAANEQRYVIAKTAAND